jgi:hypothetical protein
MAHRQIALDTAEFLDSPQARGVPGVAAKDLRKITEMLLAVCYDELGKVPRLLDGQDVEALLTRSLPAHFAAREPLAERVPALLAAFFAHLQATQVVTHAFEIQRALDQFAPAFVAAVKAGRGTDQRAPARADPFVHGASKLGRNDPCSCGSGKKYKKCHGKEA